MKTLYVLFLMTTLFSCVLGLELQKRREREASSQQVYENSCQCLRPFRLNPDSSETFEDFSYFIVTQRRGIEPQKLIPDRQGNILVSGKLVTKSGTVHEFETATIQEIGAVTEIYDGNIALGYDRDVPIKLIFTTVAVEGVKFTFVGEYLDEIEQSKLAKIDENDYTALKGVLTKYKDERKVAEAKLSLVVASR